MKSFRPLNRVQANEKAFTYLTGYQTFQKAYDNKFENRRFTDKGVVGPALEFDIDDNEEDSHDDADPQEVCL